MAEGGYTHYEWKTEVSAAKDHVEHGLSKTAVMARYGIRNASALDRWCRQYRKGGPQDLKPRKRGRAARLAGKQKQVSSSRDFSQEKLLEENEYLRTKVAWLGTLSALRVRLSRDGRKA